MIRVSLVVSADRNATMDITHSVIEFSHPRLKGFFRCRLCCLFLNLCGISSYIITKSEVSE